MAHGKTLDGAYDLEADTLTVNEYSDLRGLTTVEGTAVFQQDITLENSSSENQIILSASQVTTNYTLNLPSTIGSAGQILSTDGLGNSSWSSISTTTGGVSYIGMVLPAPFLKVNGGNTDSTYSAATFSIDFGAPLATLNGGTGLTTVGSAGNILTSDGTTLSWQPPATEGTVTSVTALSPLVSTGGSTPQISLISTTGLGATVVLSQEPTFIGLTSSFAVLQYEQDADSINGALISKGGIQFTNLYGAGGRSVPEGAPTPLLTPVYVSTIKGGVITATSTFTPTQATTLLIDGAPTPGANVNFTGTLTYALVVNGDSAVSGTLSVGGGLSSAGSTTITGTFTVAALTTFNGLISMGSLALVPAAFVSDVILAPTLPKLHPTPVAPIPTRLLGYSATIPPIEAWSLGWRSTISNFALTITNALVPTKRVYLDSFNVGLLLGVFSMIELTTSTTYNSLNLFTAGGVISGSFYCTNTVPYSGELAIYADSSLQTGAFMDKNDISLWELQGITPVPGPSIQMRNEGTYSALNVYASNAYAASLFSTSSTPFSGEFAIYSDTTLQNGAFMDKNTLEFWGPLLGVSGPPSRLISLEARNVFTGQPELTFYQGTLATVTLSPGGLKIQADASPTTFFMAGDFGTQTVTPFPYVEIEYGSLVFNVSEIPVLTFTPTALTMANDYSISTAQDFVLTSLGADGTGSLSLNALGITTASVAIVAAATTNGSISLSAAGTTATISITSVTSVSITSAAFNVTVGASSLTLGVFSLTAGATTISTGATTITTGATTITAGATTLTAGVTTITTSALTLTTAAAAITCAGGLAVSVPTGAIAITTGAGALAITTVGGALGLTCGAGILALTTVLGGINIYAVGGAITMSTTLGGVKVTCLAGDSELSSSVGACFIYAPVGGINIGEETKKNGHFQVWTTNGTTGAGTANIEFRSYKSDLNTGPGNFIVDTRNAYTGDIDFYSHGHVSLLSDAGLDIASVNNKMIHLDTSYTTSSYFWNYPSTAGTSGQFLISKGGGSNAMEWANTSSIGVLTSLSLTANLIETLTVGSSTAATQATGIQLQNSTSQVLIFGIAGSSGNYSSQAIQGDAVITNAGSKSIFLQTGSGNSAIKIDNANNVIVNNILNMVSLTASYSVHTDASKNLVSIENIGTGLNILQTSPTLITPVIGAATGTSLQLSSLTASYSVHTDASKNLVSIQNNGTGLNILQTSPTLITPILGVASGTSLQLSALTASYSVHTDASKNLVSIENSGTGLNILQISPIVKTPTVTSSSQSLGAFSAAVGIMAIDSTVTECFHVFGHDTSNTANYGLIQTVYSSSGSDSNLINFGMYNTGIAFKASGAWTLTAENYYDACIVQGSVTHYGSLTLSSAAGAVNFSTPSATITGLTASYSVHTDASKNLVSIENIGTGLNILQTSPTLITPVIGAATGTSLQLSSLTASYSVHTDASKNLVSIQNIGTGLNILQTSPTLITPILGVASGTSLTLTGNTVSQILVGSTGAGTSPTSISIQNDTTQSVIIGISGGAGQYAVGAVQGDAVIRTGGGRLLLGGIGGSAGIIVDTSANTVINGTITVAGLQRNNGAYSQAPSTVFQVDAVGVAGGRFNIDTTGNTTVGGALAVTGLTTIGGNVGTRIWVVTGTLGAVGAVVSVNLPTGVTRSNIVSISGVALFASAYLFPAFNTADVSGFWTFYYQDGSPNLIQTVVGASAFNVASQTFRITIITNS